MNKKGITLIVLTMIIALLAIIVSGIVSYISEGLRFNISNIDREKAFYVAQAGILSGIVDFQDGGLWSSAQNVNVSNEFYYQLGQNANFLLVDASSPLANGKFVKRVPIKNINAANSITITNLTVSWTFGGNITNVSLGGTKVFTGSVASPANLDITDFTITSGTAYNSSNDQVFEFSSNVSGSLITTFIFSDGSSYKTYLLKAGNGYNKEFSLKATGEIRNGANVSSRRTLIATYDSGTSKITSWEESQNHIIP